MNLFETYISSESVSLVNQCMTNERISAGKMADKFEQELKNILGVSNPITLNSGTSALHLALILANVGVGDEVILPAQTFIATGLAILYTEATPVFCDIDINTGNIDTNDVIKKITKKTKAIMSVDWAGYPCDYDELKSICKSYNLKLIEDSAHAIGAEYKNSPIGSISDFTIFSFQSIKHLTCGDGGAVCCLNKEDEKRGKKLRWFSIDRDLDLPDILGERVYNASDIGYKYHLNDLAASMGIGNLYGLKDRLQRVRNIADYYNKNIKETNKLSKLRYKGDRLSSYWLYPIRVENRVEFITLLKNNNIPTSVVHLGIDKNNIFGSINNTLIHQRLFDETQINIPINFKMTDSDVNNVVDTINKGW